MSTPGSPVLTPRSPQLSRNEYTSSYADHYSPRPSSAPPGSLTLSSLSSLSSFSHSPSPSSPSTPRYAETETNLNASPTTSRYGKFAWNRSRNPLLDGEVPRYATGKKPVPSYFENLEKEDEDTKRLSRKSRPAPSPFLVDPTRAGIPTVIQKIRTREEDLFHPRNPNHNRPSTAPSYGYGEIERIRREREERGESGESIKRERRPCQIDKFNTRRNPLIESGDAPTPRRTLIGFNKESDNEFQLGKKTLVIPASLQKVTRTTDTYIPGELPPEPTIRLRTNYPEDSDVFNHTHPLVAPSAPHLVGALEKETSREVQEKELEKAYQQRVAFYNDEIKKFKQKAKLKGQGL